MSKVTVNICIQRMSEAKRAIDQLYRIKAACEQDLGFAKTLQKVMLGDEAGSRQVVPQLTAMIARLEDYNDVLKNVLDKTPVEWPPFSDTTTTSTEDK